MSEIIGYINAFGRKWKVETRELDDCHGVFDVNTGIISIDDKLDEGSMQSVLLHECLHLCELVGGFTIKEDTVWQLQHLLPELIEFKVKIDST